MRGARYLIVGPHLKPKFKIKIKIKFKFKFQDQRDISDDSVKELKMDILESWRVNKRLKWSFTTRDEGVAGRANRWLVGAVCDRDALQCNSIQSNAFISLFLCLLAQKKGCPSPVCGPGLGMGR